MGSQSHLCGQRLESGSGSLFRDTATKVAPAASFEPIVMGFESID